VTRALAFIALLGPLLASCQEPAAQAPAAPIAVNGLANFGNVILGTEVDTIIILDNRDSSTAASASLGASPPFYVLSYQPSSCSVAIVPAQAACAYKIGFSPSAAGQFSSLVSFRGESALLSGVGVAPGAIAASPTSFQFGSLAIGGSKAFTVHLANSGNSAIAYPAFQSPSEISVQSTTCEATLAPGAQCEIALSLTPQKTSANYSGSLNILGPGGVVAASVRLSGSILPGDAVGGIALATSPANIASLVAGSIITVSTSTIVDIDGNAVADGTPVTISVNNLALAASPQSTSEVVTTSNGIATFAVIAGPAIGQATAFAQASAASYGSIAFQVTP
jgi:hypothetical protein